MRNFPSLCCFFRGWFCQGNRAATRAALHSPANIGQPSRQGHGTRDAVSFAAGVASGSGAVVGVGPAPQATSESKGPVATNPIDHLIIGIQHKLSMNLADIGRERGVGVGPNLLDAVHRLRSLHCIG